MEPFATTLDIEELWRTLKQDETTRAKSLLIVISDSLRVEANKVGKDIELMILNSASYSNVVKSVVVDVVARTLMTSTEQEPMTQTTESALGYSFSGSYLVPGGGLFIKNSELSRLGLKRQRYGVIDLYGENQRNTGYFS